VVEEEHKVLNICPRHRADYGIRWRTRKTNCTVPDDLAAHRSASARGTYRVDSQQSAYIFQHTKIVVAVGARKFYFNIFHILFLN